VKMDWGSPEARARRVFLLLLAALAALVGRTGFIQVVEGDEYAARAHRQHFRRIRVPAPRGRILDRNGRALAASYHAVSVAADPQEVDDVHVFAARVAFLLGEPEAAQEFAARLGAMKKAGKRFVYLRRRLDRERVRRLAEDRPAGLDLREEPRREYPHGAAAAALVGVVGVDEDGGCVGLTGLERQFDALLTGEDGSCSVFRSGTSERLHLFPERARPARPGADVRTTIDIALQQVVEQELDDVCTRFRPDTCCAIALDPRNGEVLALASRPGFDPLDFPRVGAAALNISAIQSSYEHGSTIKPLVMAWALSRGAVHLGQEFDCGPGHKFFGRRLLHDVKPNGVLDLEHILIKSSNIGIAQVGLALGIDETYGLFRRLGLGRATGIEFSGEQTGSIPARADWTENYVLVSAAMGRQLPLTPLQLVTAYAALVNGGFLHRPTLVRGAPRPAPVRVGFTDEALHFVREAMVKVVEEGTAKRARVPGLRIGGKTGSAERYPIGRNGYVSSVVGFAPADAPELVVLVLADNPQRERPDVKPYGGVVAAPAVGNIFRRGLPLLRDKGNSISAPAESGVRQYESSKEMVRVAAVNSSSVYVGKRTLPAEGRNPDSVGASSCRSVR